jgi:hypothetical protein
MYIARKAGPKESQGAATKSFGLGLGLYRPRRTLPPSASLHVFVDFHLGVIWQDMKNIKNTRCGGWLQKHHFSTLVVRPLSRQIKHQRRDCAAQSNQILNKLHEINQSIETIAQEIARQAKRLE